MNLRAAIKRWWGTEAPFITIKSAEGSRTFPGVEVTREEYEAWRQRIHEGLKQMRKDAVE